MYVTQLQPFAQSVTFKLLSLRFTLMVTFNHHKFFKVSSLREHLSGLKILPALLNKRSTGTDIARVDRSLFASFANVGKLIQLIF